jgi:uncharacterized cupredoxin-like copper-binding protein
MTRQANQEILLAASRRPLTALMAVLMLGLAGCGDDGESAATTTEAAPEVTELGVVASGSHTEAAYAFELPDRVPAGLTRMSLINDGDERHHAQLFRLNDDADIGDLAAALATGDPAAALTVGTFEGGTALVEPGATSRADAVVELTEGSYALICFVPGPDGLPHLAHGMLRPFDVVAAGTPAPPTDPPPADVDVELVDYGFELPDTVPADAALEVTNTATAEPHEMIVARLDDGAEADDTLAAVVAGEPAPLTVVGGVQALLPGSSQRLQFDLDAGEYVVMCEIPSPDGTPHVNKGMFRPVTVS